MAIIKVDKTFQHNESTYQRLIVSTGEFIDRYPIMMPNCYTQPDNEADVFCIRKSDLCDEFEIKVTRSDFLKDREKRIQYREIVKDSDLFSASEWEQWCSDGRIEGTEPWKMNKLEAYKAGQGIPNYFWYVLKEGIVTDESEIPDWAGVAIVSKFGMLRVRRRPKMLHKTKISDQLKHKTMMKGVHRYLDNVRGWRNDGG